MKSSGLVRLDEGLPASVDLSPKNLNGSVHNCFKALVKQGRNRMINN